MINTMRSLRQQLFILVMGPLIVMAISGAIFTGLFMRDRAIYAADEKARGDLATGEAIINLMHPGYWHVENGILYKGDVKINNNYASVDKIAELTGDTVTIFQGDTRVSTTVRSKNGDRAIGTKVSDQVAERVLKNGQIYVGQANVVGELYHTAYKPIRDIEGKIIGMLYVGISKNLSEELIANSLLKIAVFSTILTMVVAFLGWLFAKRVIIGPIERIAETTKEMVTNSQINKLELNNTKEVADLSNAFNQMVEGLQNIAVQITKATGNTLEVRDFTCPMSETSSACMINSEVKPEFKNDVNPENNKPDSRFIDIPENLRDLPKGLNEGTLKQVFDFFTGKDGYHSAEEVGEGVNISSVTARRYLEYLEKTGYANADIKHGTVGRPVKLYKLSVS